LVGFIAGIATLCVLALSLPSKKNKESDNAKN
jgi:hypothetical protein